MTQMFIGMSLDEVLGGEISVSSHRPGEVPFSAPSVAAANPHVIVTQEMPDQKNAGSAADLAGLVLGNKPNGYTRG